MTNATDTVTGSEPTTVEPTPWESIYRERLVPMGRYLRRNKLMAGGLSILGVIVLLVIIGHLFYQQDDRKGNPQRVSELVYAASVPPRLKPSWNPWGEYPLGTDEQGRDILAHVLIGTPKTFRIGAIAAAIGIGVGLILAFVGAYAGGWADLIVRLLVDSLIPIPGLLVLILIATSLNPGQGLTENQLAFAIAVLAWPGPARVIRSQVLVMRERGYVTMAQMSGTSALGIIFKEMMPNLAPYLLASYVAALTGAMLATIGVETLGLGDIDAPTLGAMLYWIIFTNALLKAQWWWLVPPIIVIVALFVGLFMISAGLDEVANPRLRRRV